MNHDLFRKEVFAARAKKSEPGIQIQTPLIGWVFLSLGIIFVVAAACVIAFGHYTRRIHVEGVILSRSDTSQLQAEFWLPAREINYVNQGGRITFHNTNSPDADSEKITGVVAQISRNVYVPGDLKNDARQKFAEPSYRVLVTLNSTSDTAKADDLIPGTALSAELFQEKKMLWDWIAKPGHQ